MRSNYLNPKRSGAIIPLMAILLIAIIGVTALAVDIGALTVAKNQAQSIVDAAAFAGARTLNGKTDNNVAQVPFSISSTVSKMVVLNQAPSEVKHRLGTYSYDSNAKNFKIILDSKKTGESWSAVQVTIKNNPSASFGKIFNISSFTVNATATAAYRPRDIAMILDFSDSLRAQSFTGLGNRPPEERTSRNANPNYPDFGCWEIEKASMVYTTNSPPASNITQAENDNLPLVNDFFYHGANNSVNPAFKDFFDMNYSKVPNYLNGVYGDIWPKVYNQDARANTAQQVVQGASVNVNNAFNDSAFRAGGYDGKKAITSNDKTNKRFGGFQNTFKGYTIAPGYYGKTFYIWPPDPRTDKDWRRLYFGVADNSKLFYSDGNKRPAVENGVINYTPDYTKILNWIKNIGPNPFPPNLKAGRIIYYETIPDQIPTTGSLTLDQLFWKEYIDYVLGNKIYPLFGHFGPDNAGRTNGFKGTRETMYGWPQVPWGTVKITSRDSMGTSVAAPYMNYSDNPLHPRMHFWFGPLSMITFLSDYFLGRNWLPGTCHETPTWQLKQCVKAVLDDIEENHPNDIMTLVFFSSLDRYNNPKTKLSRNFDHMRNSLFYPSSVINPLTGNLINGAYVRPYEARSSRDLRDITETTKCDIPNAQGFTSIDMGLKVAFNQFSSTGGYDGRLGAGKIVFLESDGAPTRSCQENGFNGSIYDPIKIKSDNNNANRLQNRVDSFNVIDKFVEKYSTPKNPIQIHSIAFGSAAQADAGGREFLTNAQRINGKTTTTIAAQNLLPTAEPINIKIRKLKSVVSDAMQSTVLISLVE